MRSCRTAELCIHSPARLTVVEASKRYLLTMPAGRMPADAPRGVDRVVSSEIHAGAHPRAAECRTTHGKTSAENVAT